jgi:hypothetical protein
MSHDGDEPAFPVPDGMPNVNGDFHPGCPGMSKRLYLAAKAMEGLLAGGARTSGIAPVAFSIADEMLAVLYAPGRLEKVSDDLQDLKAAVAALLPFIMKMEEAKEAVEMFCPKSAPQEAACLRVHEIMTRLSST